GETHADCAVQRPGQRRGAVCRAGEPHRLRDRRTDPGQHEPDPAGAGLPRRPARTVLAARRAAGLRRGDVRLSRRAARRAGDRRRRSRPVGVRQGDRRGHAGRCDRRPGAGDGDDGAAGTGLPGGYVVGEPDRDGRGAGDDGPDRRARLLRAARRRLCATGRRHERGGARGGRGILRAASWRHGRAVHAGGATRELRAGAETGRRALQALLSPDARRGRLPSAVAGRGVLLLGCALGRRRRCDDRGRGAGAAGRGVMREGESGQGAQSYLPVLLFGCAILVISTGVRSSFGLFLPEMTQARGWSRETFSFAIALQNLMWGLGGSFLGAMADKYGSMRTLLLGAALYVVGFLGMAYAETGATLSLSAGIV